MQGLTAYFLVTEQIEEAYRLAATALGIARRRADDDEFLEASAWLGTIQFFQVLRPRRRRRSTAPSGNTKPSGPSVAELSLAWIRAF